MNSLPESAIFILNKPSGMTSQQAVTRVRRFFGYKKAGHSGILDPQVTGVLPIFLGRATRLAEYISEERKHYLATVRFGWATDTQDATGQTIATGDTSTLREEQIEEALLSFVGTSMQVPPAFSAIHVDGKRAYELARRGEMVELAPRSITIYALEVEAIIIQAHEVTARFAVTCSKGTYIRTLCHDLGSRLGVPAHMASLIRTRSGPFVIEDAYTLAQMEQSGMSLLLEPYRAVASMPWLEIDDVNWRKLCCGNQLQGVFPLDQIALDSLIRIHDKNGQLGAIYKLASHDDHTAYTLLPVKVFAAKKE